MSASQKNNDNRELAAWVIWVIAQLIILSLLAARVPLSAGFPKPVENAAPIAVTVTQLILAISLAPRLLANWRAVAMCSAATIPITTFATILAGATAQSAIAPAALVILWLATLHALNRVRGLAVQIIIRSLLLLLAVGGPILWYVDVEYGRNQFAVTRVLSALSPTMGVITTCLHPQYFWWISLFPAAIAMSLCIVTRTYRQPASMVH
ncbi:MAG: hypothetical protein H7144_14545 [Burkholderiales bacterium]|nr:hypothetical protein [Phycisphaerae bacterium]